MTPLLKKYRTIKTHCPNAILWYRCGDFIEAMEEDARITAENTGLRILKSCKSGVDMCGFPAHAMDRYLSKMVHNGFKVAVYGIIVD